MSHVTYECKCMDYSLETVKPGTDVGVMSNMSNIWMSQVTNEWVMSHIYVDVWIRAWKRWSQARAFQATWCCLESWPRCHGSLANTCMCCSVLQCVAVCCGVFQYVAVCCLESWPRYHGSLANTCMCCTVLQCVAVCCNVLQCVAMCFSMMQCVALSHGLAVTNP